MTIDATRAHDTDAVADAGTPSGAQGQQPASVRAEDDHLGPFDSKKNGASKRGRDEGSATAGRRWMCAVTAQRTTTVTRTTQVARATRLRRAAAKARTIASPMDETHKIVVRAGEARLASVRSRLLAAITVLWTMRQRRAPNAGRRAQLGARRVNVPTRDSPLSPAPIQTPATPSHATNGPTMQFVALPRTLQDNLWDGPARKRKRASSGSRSRSRSPKRGRWEDSLDSETLDWVEELRMQTTSVLMDSAAKTTKIGVLEEKIAYLQRTLAETRWTLAEKTGQTVIEL
ncbi:hypothetical protein AURDEDRAFT_126436 [Auricularia subglabra TFB-10046 SS5]|nr:hypothetical protein AURDEDRAFT_126436 [Auricularia subglabra TFB-10046 SS5]